MHGLSNKVRALGGVTPKRPCQGVRSDSITVPTKLPSRGRQFCRRDEKQGVALNVVNYFLQQMFVKIIIFRLAITSEWFILQDSCFIYTKAETSCNVLSLFKFSRNTICKTGLRTPSFILSTRKVCKDWAGLNRLRRSHRSFEKVQRAYQT